MEDKTMPIAVVGMSCRLPGHITSPEELWRVCDEQRDVWQAIPADRLNREAYYHPDPNRNGTSNVKGAHFLGEHPGRFDARFFNATPAEAKAMDPQQRLLLELSYEALETAGITLTQISDSDAAVFIGSSCRDYADLLQRDAERTEMYQSTGTGQTMLSNRISYFYNLKGQSVTVDTACSSSLVALHLACTAIRAGESRTAIVGGSNLILSHEPIIALSMLRFLSPDGRCYTYDDRANGFGRGEGAGCLIIKPLDDAIRDGNHIRAIIRHSGSNQDGRTNGISLPNGDAQVELMNNTYKAAGLDPTQTRYVEAHGTGTPAGDPIEAAALSKVFCQNRSAERPLYVGSVKSNIGHLEGGSGISGVIKTVLMLEKRTLLPNFDFQRPSPRIPMDEWRIKVPAKSQCWPDEAVYRASVNNFGFGGSNAHVILEDPTGYLASHGLSGSSRDSPTGADTKYGLTNGLTNGCPDGTASIKANGGLGASNVHPTQFFRPCIEPSGEPCDQEVTDRPSAVMRKTKELSTNHPSMVHRPHVFVLSSSDEQSLKRQAHALSSYLQDRETDEPSPMLYLDLSYTLGSHRSILPWKLAFTANSLNEVIQSLSSDRTKLSRSVKSKALGFVFTGQGAQWHAMGRELISQYPVFNRSLQSASKQLQHLGASWSLLDELTKDASTSLVNDAALSQPLTTAIQIALVDLLASWNIQPAKVIGHSSGEIAAAYCAGALTQRRALTVAYHRGRVALKLKEFREGAMLAVGLSVAEVSPLIASLCNGGVRIACINSHANTTVSGDRSGILELLGILQAKGIFARQLSVQVAYHSHHMEDVAHDYLAALGRMSVETSGTVEFHSSLRGKRVGLCELGPTYWVENLVNAVRFSDALQSLSSNADRTSKNPGVEILVEIGPHSALQGPIKQTLQQMTQARSPGPRYLSSLTRHRDAVQTCQELAAQLFGEGLAVNLDQVNFPRGAEDAKLLTNLPPYQWDHSSFFWAQSANAVEFDNQSHTRSDILGVRARDVTSSELKWRNIVRPSEIPWVNDHVVQGNVLYPAAGFLAMAIEAAYQQSKSGNTEIIAYKLREISIGHALMLPQDAEDVETSVSLRPYGESLRADSEVWHEFRISSSVDGSSWTEHCRGLISAQRLTQSTEVDAGRQAKEEAEQVRSLKVLFDEDCEKTIDTQDLYRELEQLGLKFGPLFANMQVARVSSERCIAGISIPDTSARMPAQFEYPFIIHPATLDSCLHSVFPIGSGYSQKDLGTPVPTFIEELSVAHSVEKTPGHCFSAYAEVTDKSSGRKPGSGLGQKKYSIKVFDQSDTEGKPSITMDGLKFNYIANTSEEEAEAIASKDYYQTEWQLDPDFLTAEQASELTAAFRKPFPQDDHVYVSQQAAFYYANMALQALGPNADEIPNLQPHHRKLYLSLSRSCDEIREGHFGMFSTREWLDSPPEERLAVCARVADTPYGLLLCQVGAKLASIISNEIDPLSVMLESDRLERYYRTYEPIKQSYEQAAVYVKLLGNKNPHMNILEVGAGTGAATQPILEALSADTGSGSPSFVNYDFTDISLGFFEKAKEKVGGWGDLVSFRKLDIEQDTLAQGFAQGSYDLIIAANVVHATSRIESSLQRMRSLLKPGGTLILIEITVPTLGATLIFGTLPGWWNAEEKTRAHGPLLSQTEWEEALHHTGFNGTDTVLWDMPDPASHQGSVIISKRLDETISKWPAVTIITDVERPPYCLPPLEHLLVQMNINHNTTSLAECSPHGRVCIVLSELTQSVLRNPHSSNFDALKRVLLESAGVLWITKGAHIEASHPDAKLATGLARTIRVEQGDTRIDTLDFDAEFVLSPEDMAETIVSVLRSNFGSDKDHGNTQLESEFVERGGQLMILRIVKDNILSAFETASSVPCSSNNVEPQPFFQPGRPLKAEIKTPGLLDSIRFVNDDSISGKLAEDEVDVEVKASGLNFRDVMTALGQIAQYPLGCECSGVVTSVGDKVHGLSVGDHVIATVKDGSFRNAIRASANEVESIPGDVPFEVAAALPVAYFTAYWAVHKVARLLKGESILIHAASGGLGQALISLCRIVGAEIYATVGTVEKKKLLMERYLIPEARIFSSRDTTFAKGIMTMTGGRGVDVIMNSLSGEALRLSWSCIAPFGRFVELGKRDFTVNTRLEMRHFEKNVSFTGLDVPLDSHHVEKRRIWVEIMEMYKSGLIGAPWPVNVFGISEMESALRTMQSGKHMGKMILMPRPGEMVKATVPRKAVSNLLRPDASYLLVGGLGGIGRATAFWMLKNGAKNFIFASPSGADKDRAREAVTMLEEQGARVIVCKCDVSNMADVDGLLQNQSASGMPPIRGMIHGALVSKADLFARMTLQDYNDVMKPKVDGIWNLHNSLSKIDLDFFIMLSSVVGIAGDPSQAAYVAASVFQDAFAAHRNYQGLPAVTLDLGKVVDIGIVAEKFAARRGVRGLWSRDLREDEVMRMIEFAIMNPLPNKRGGCHRPAANIIGLKPWSETEADPVFLSPIFSHFRRAAVDKRCGGSGSSIDGKVSAGSSRPARIRDRLRRAKTLGEAVDYISGELIAKMSSILMIPIEDISKEKSMMDLGMDSLVAVEMRNWLLREVDAALPILELMANVSLGQLAVKVVKRSKVVDAGALEDGQ